MPSRKPDSVLVPPTASRERAEILLRGHAPAWWLSPDFVVLRTNLLAAWLWGATRAPDVLGVSVYDIYSRPGNIIRLPVEENREFFERKLHNSFVLSRVYGRRSAYATFQAVMQTDPGRRAIYQREVERVERGPALEREWEYALNIRAPDASPDERPLRFQTTVSQIQENADVYGFVVHNEPRGGMTTAVIRGVRDRFETIDGLDYVHSADRVEDAAWDVAFGRNREPAGFVGADAYQTLVFDREADYVAFVRAVYARHGGKGLELTDAPIVSSVRVRPWLVTIAQDKFRARPVTERDIAAARESVRGRKPFDLNNLATFRIPGADKPTAAR